MVSVRAVHTFVAEHGDELEFHAGEAIEVLEKDDAFGDGWWRGRNIRGEEGLFPATYITEASTEFKPDSQLLAPPASIMPEESPKGGNSESTHPILENAHSEPTLMGPTIDSVQHAIDKINTPELSRDGDLGIGQDTRARLAEQAKRANEQRDLQRASGGVAGLVYSDESDDDEAEMPGRNVPNGLGRQSTPKSPGPDPIIPPAAQSKSIDEKIDNKLQALSLQPAPALPSTPPIPHSGSDSPKPRNSLIPSKSPTTWSVDEVVQWAEAKGFDDSVCDKFKEHEISGDLLLELDANLLKELDIPQFGKRLRIAQAIMELRRPTSVISTSSQQLSPGIPIATASNTSLRGMSAPPQSQMYPLIPTSGQTDIDHSAWSHGSRKTSSTQPAMEPISEGQTAIARTSTSSSVPPSPVTPSSGTTKRESSDSMGHKKSKPSIEKERLSLFGRSRKPAPGPSPNALATRATSSSQTHEITPSSPGSRPASTNLTNGTAVALKQIGVPDRSGYLKKKGDRYPTWKTRFFALKGAHLYYMKNQYEDRIKGQIDLRGHRVIVDEGTNPGSYGFRLVGTDKTHFFSSSEQIVVREWMKSLMKATIARDYTVPVTSSSNIPTIPLAEAEALSPRPPSPATRDAAQRANRRENVNQLTARDASVLMSLEPSNRRRSTNLTPSRPERDTRRPSNSQPRPSNASFYPADDESYADLVKWVNSLLPPPFPKAGSLPGSFMSGEVIFLLVRSLSGIEPDPPVSPEAFKFQDGLPGVEGLFAMMDVLLDAGVDTAGVSINEVRTGNAPAIARLLESVKGWTESLKATS